MRDNHEAIGAVIIKDGMWLMMDHVKLSFWTIPIGKVELKQTVVQALKQELKEELNITPTRFKKVTTFKNSYMRAGKKINIHCHIFHVESWSGSIKNNEPLKHKSIKWMSIPEIKKLRKISDATKAALKHMPN